MGLTRSVETGLDVLANEERRRRVNLTEIISDMKKSAFLCENWDTLLLAVPNCLGVLGNIGLVASHPWAGETRLKGDFKYINVNLGVALSNICDEGFKTLGIARNNMSKIQHVSASTTEQMKVISRALASPDAPMSILASRLDMLKDTASSCSSYIREIEESLNMWSEFVYELYGACNNSSASTEEQRSRASFQNKYAEDDKNHRSDRETEARAEIKKLEDALKSNKEACKGALETEIETLLSGLAESAGAALSIYATVASPAVLAGKASTGLLSLIGAANSTGANAAEDETDLRKATDKTIGLLSTKLSSTVSGKFFANDPALAIVSALTTSVGLIKTFVVALPTGPNWDSAIRKDPSSPSELEAVSGFLGRLLRDFVPRKDGVASQLLVATIKEAIGVTNEIWEHSKKSDKPTRESTTFKSWEERISRCYLSVVALDAASQSIPGNLGTQGVSLDSQKESPETRIQDAGNKQVAAEQIIRCNTTSLSNSRQAYVATLEAYHNSSANLQRIQNTLAEARAEFKSLEASKLSLQEINKLLISCMGYLIEFKDRISKLAVGFSKLTMLTNLCKDHQIGPFDNEMKSLSRSNETKATNYSSYCKDIILRAILQISASFSLYKDLATVYLEVDANVTMEGLMLLEQSRRSNFDLRAADENFERQQRNLLDYNNKAKERVFAVVKHKHDDFTKDIESRIETIGKALEQYPGDLRPDLKATEAASNGACLAIKTTESLSAQRSGIELATAWIRGL